jgi:hypothetical protein
MMRKPKALLAAPTAVAAGEIVPLTHSVLHKKQDTATQLSGAAKEMAQSAKVTSIPYNLQRFTQSGIGRGIGGGAAAAGILALLTGLLRGRSQREIAHDRGRAGMVTSDFMKYLLPAMAAGGVIGSLRNRT